MRCLYPRTVGFQDDGSTLAWTYKQSSKEYAQFQLPCGKCINCRLEYARDCATRCTHESQMYDQNSFVTLTYADEHLGFNILDPSHFQTFINDLRGLVFRRWLKHIGKSQDWYDVLPKPQRKALYAPIEMPYFATGEYGEKSKRMHWHALLFNFRPDDLCYKYSTDLGHQVYTSEMLEKIWPYGQLDIGSVTYESAGYVARYSVKKLAHGKDQDHSFNPVHLRSKKHAIGKKWLEKYYKSDCFNQGFIVLQDGTRTSIPRYYVKWLKKNDPKYYAHFLTLIRNRNMLAAQELQTQRLAEETLQNDARRNRGHHGNVISALEKERFLAADKLNKLNKHLKGDF